MMRTKKQVLFPFCRSIRSESLCFRPENEKQLQHILIENPSQKLLPRGSGLSYSDSSLNTNRHIIDTQRLNHFIHFDSHTGILECQAAVTIKELLELHPEFIPPVVPGTVFATVGGCIAHDVHGKNNVHTGSFGHHVLWLDLLMHNQQIIRCSREEHPDLFNATIAGLGLTGIIIRVGLRLKKASSSVQVNRLSFKSKDELMTYMSYEGLQADYQMAWLDLLNPEKGGIVSVAKHVTADSQKEPFRKTLPQFPFCVLNKWTMSYANQYIFSHYKKEEVVSFQRFNNPLDQVSHWNSLYGPKGFIQFQAVFDEDDASHTLSQLIQLIQFYKAVPILSVLKLFRQQGHGMLSFCKSGFTLAIDFHNNQEAHDAILAMNQYICDIGGRIYLAKDLLLTPQQMNQMYDKLDAFKAILANYKSSMISDLAKRLRIIE